MATHSSVLAWRIPGTVKPDGPLSMGSYRVGHDWSDLVAAVAAAARRVTLDHLSNLPDPQFLVYKKEVTQGGPPRWLSSKESACQCSRRRRPGFDPWVRKMPWRRKWQLTPVFLPGESQGQRSLADYSPRGHKELEMTERARACTHTHTHTHTHTQWAQVFQSPQQVDNNLLTKQRKLYNETH